MKRLVRSGKMLLRSVQVEFPFLVESKFSVMRAYRNAARRPFEADFAALSLFPESDGAVFLDVGANRGQSTDAILMHRKRGTIHLFEPNGVLAVKLHRMFRANGRVVIHEVGLGATPSNEVLTVPVYNGWAFDGLGSFDRSEAEEWLRGRMYFYRDDRLRFDRSNCTLVRLDDLGLKPTFIKLDVQGYELKALIGGEATLREHQPMLLIESPSDELIDYLARLGYDFYAFVGGRFQQRTVGAPNTFFLSTQQARSVAGRVVENSGPIIRL